MVDIEVRNLDAKLVQFTVILSNFRDETQAVFIPEIRAHSLINARPLSLESWEPCRASCRVRERAHDVVGLQKRDLIQARKASLKIQSCKLSHSGGVDHRVGRFCFL